MNSKHPLIPSKWMLRAHDQHNVFYWGKHERSTHTIMKAMLWALYLPQYPNLQVEVRIGDRYKPDVVAMPGVADVYQATDQPLFWGESERVGRKKIEDLVRRYPGTHFAIAKWSTGLKSHEKTIQGALKGVRRSAPFDLISFPADTLRRFVDDEGNVCIAHDDLDWVRFE